MRCIVSSPTLTDKVAKDICQDILSGELKPNQKLVVAELKEKYNVGASPIREALIQLSWIKYVKLEPQKGCWVAPISKTELYDLHESLNVVASVLLEKSIQQGNENWELNILTEFHKLSRFKFQGDSFNWKEWEERQEAFYLALFSGCFSKNMQEFLHDVIRQIKRYRQVSLSRYPKGFDEIFRIEEHEKIMKLTLDKDLDAAKLQLSTFIGAMIKEIEPQVDAIEMA
ncbi:GntR family transcriptional regulator [Vibrio methylphosphonaticus]|uniref:GntR family transcriptional regulator n=1 Tax=Vibrio methylphosphonaticus TaxID=2946866 RepID=UPI00202AB831|nr:GntR family transcriptional regulator [Vibrio methylphosphonaticus]MCL9773446.1 GntR family transcriptional regulator [Vibrio methylphosphonaticus]